MKSMAVDSPRTGGDQSETLSDQVYQEFFILLSAIKLLQQRRTEMEFLETPNHTAIKRVDEYGCKRFLRD